MQYVRNLSDSVSTAWNSINPATLSGAIDVIVVEQEDGTLSCSPFHVRFGKFSLLRPYEKKVEFKVNGAKQDYSMKLGEGGEAFFVFETTENIPQSLQTSPLVSPASSPPFPSTRPGTPSLQEPETLDLNEEIGKPRSASFHRPPPTALYSVSGPDGLITPRSTSPELSKGAPSAADWSPQRPYSDDILRRSARKPSLSEEHDDSAEPDSPLRSERSISPPPLAGPEALQRAITIARELSAVNIPTHITDRGDLMVDLTEYKGSDEDAFRAEILARKVLAEELNGHYDIGALFGVDEHGNLWIYSSHEAKDAAMKRTLAATLGSSPVLTSDAASDPGYHSDGSDITAPSTIPGHRRAGSDVGQLTLQTPPSSPGSPAAGDPNRNYAKTLRLTSDQLKALKLTSGINNMSFTVNRATCSANMYLWRYDVPVVISDIDGTITKSDALGHVLTMIGRDWTHAGVAKLYSDIAANGYNIMYLTSRSVGQADMTRAYLAGILQDNYRVPRGPTILSPDRTMAALRREIYLRKPQVFKMATLRDIRALYGADRSPFYAGFGNRFTDQISYRTVDVPRSRIFTINSNAEVSMDLLSLNKLKLSYVNMTEVVDHYFPPVSTLVKGGGEQYTDFLYWRDQPLDLDDFSASDSSDQEDDDAADQDSQYAEDEYEDEEAGDPLAESYISRASADDYGEGSVMSGDYEEGEADDKMMNSILEDNEDADDEDEEAEEAIANNGAKGAAAVEAAAEATSKKLPSPQVATVQDLSAELMTGMKALSLEKKVEEPLVATE